MGGEPTGSGDDQAAGLRAVVRQVGQLAAVRAGPWTVGEWAGLALLTALAALPRFVDLDRCSLWTDEFITRGAAVVPRLWDAGHPIVIHNHPPGWGWVVWLWTRLAGDGENGLRSLSALCGTLTPAVVWIVARRAVSRPGAWLAATWIAIWPLHVHYSRQAEVYAFYALLVVVQLGSFLALTRPGRTPRWWDWARHGAIVALHIATFNLAAAFLVVENLVLWASPARRAGRWKGWLALQAAAWAGVAVAAWRMRAHFEWYVGGGSPVGLGVRLERLVQLPWWLAHFAVEQGMMQALRHGWMRAGSDLQWGWAGPLLWSLAVLAAVWIAWARRAGRGDATTRTGDGVAWLAYGLIPLAVYALAAPEFRGVKAFLAAGFALALLAGEALALTGRGRRTVPAMLALLLALALVPGTVHVKRHHGTIEIRQAVEWLEQRRGPIEVPGPTESVEPVVVHMGHLYCAAAYYAVPEVPICAWPTQAIWAPGDPHGELREVFFPVTYTIAGPYDESGSYDIEFTAALGDEERGWDACWLILADDDTFADPDRGRLRAALAPYRVIDGAAFDGVMVLRLCRMKQPWCAAHPVADGVPEPFSVGP